MFWQFQMVFEHTKYFTKLNFDEFRVPLLSYDVGLEEDGVTLDKALASKASVSKKEEADFSSKSHRKDQ